MITNQLEFGRNSNRFIIIISCWFVLLLSFNSFDFSSFELFVVVL